MSDRADQRTSSYSYSPGWRQFSRIILHPGLRLRAATADITALLAAIRQETPPAVPWDPAAGGRVPLGRTDGRPGGHLQLAAVT